ncbi:MAG: sugar ABC transporter substrate-binding protein, partial [Nocardiopsaceae bacterium]|nr:sugar ABC transporter substrate-binding protein [Nocardiopsaceae bacterium]
AAAVAALSGCISTAPAGSGKSGADLVYFIFNGYTPPYFAPMAQGITAASKYYPDLDIKTVSANGSSSQEISDIQTAVAAGAKGIILNAVDTSVTQAAQHATSQGVPVVTIDRDISDPSARVAFIGDDDTRLGEQEATSCLSGLSASGLPKPWHVAILQGTLGATTATDRASGTKSALKHDIRDGTVKVVLDQSANFDTGTAQQTISSLLASHPDLQAVIAGNDAMALGAISALKSNGLTPGKKTLVCGVDAQPEDLTDIAAGTQYNTVTHSPYLEAFWAVEAMDNYLRHHVKPPASDAHGDVLLPQTVVTAANVKKIKAWGTPSTIPPLPYGTSASHKAG